MKIYLPVVALFTFLIFSTLAFAGDGIETMDLSGQWEFGYTPKHLDTIPPPDVFKTTMEVPGCWDDYLTQDHAKKLWPDVCFNPDYQPLKLPVKANFANAPDASLPYLLGTGWYRKTIKVPAASKDRRVILRVGRTVMEAWVYLDGKKIHHQQGHNVPWTVDLTPHLSPGKKHELILAVDNTRTDRIGCDIRGWKGRSAGIFGPVSIRVAGRARIADLFVFPEDDQLTWRVELAGKSLSGTTLTWRIEDPRSHKVLARGIHEVTDASAQWKSSARDIPRWSPKQPNLVNLILELRSGDELLDRLRQPLGVRRLERDGIGLRLDGRPVYLRGLCEMAYFPETCTPPLEDSWYRRHVQKLKSLGFNWIRGHTWPLVEPYLRAADELGMFVQVEPPRGYSLDEWRAIVRTCRKHPSVVIYCCGNEETLDEPKIAFLRRCAEELRREAPDALFNPQEAMRGVEYHFKGTNPADMVQEPFPHHPGRLAALRTFSDVFGQYSWGLVSYGSLKGNWRDLSRRLAVYQRPCLTHELGICGCYLDLNLQPRYENTRIGTELFTKVRQSLREADVLDRAGVYYRHAAAWQRLMLKDAIETARKCKYFAGYDLLGAIDGHWHRSGYCCGFMNEFDELKPGRSAADILQFNGESVLLMDDQRSRNLKAGEPLARDIWLSWFGDDTLRDATLKWSVGKPSSAKISAEKPVSAEKIIGPIAPGEVKPIASLEIPTPKLDKPAKVTLDVTLETGGRTLHNHWDFWLFPEPPEIDPSNILVVNTLDARTFPRLVDGARVVLLGHKPFPARATSFQMGLAGRPNGNLATVIADHPLMERFPHDGYCDWQCSRMLNGGAAIQFDLKDRSFDPILEVVSSYKRIQKQAALFEWRVGKGRLLVCSLRLAESDPAADYFRWLLLDYAAGDTFRPPIAVSPTRLAEALKLPPPKLEKQAETDQGYDERGQLPKKQSVP